ncbi:MAG TPA: response regulator [Ignavibacteria bacterium]|nr:response regulator [Ignavibacteria bacterium]
MESKPVEILLIEDDPSDIKLTLKALQKYSLANKVTVLKDGEEALEFLFSEGRYEGRDNKNMPKVIFLNLKLPFVDGIEVLRRIKSDESTRRIPVVVVTSSRENRDIEECYKLGVNSYIVKPIDFEKFLESVSNLGLYWVLMNESPF